MLERFFPDEYVKSIFHVDYEKLYNKGIRFIIFDIDNTIEPYYVPVPGEKNIVLFEALKKLGFTLCLVSNNKSSRVVTFNESLGFPAVWSAMKPLRKGIMKIMKITGAKKCDTVLIGDQVFTDVWCARRVGIHSVLVDPIAPKDEFTVRLKRGLEKMVIAKYLKNKRPNSL